MSISDEQESGPRNAERAAAGPSGLSSQISSEPPIPNAPPPTSLFDPAVLLGVCGEEEELLRQLCDDFKTYAPQRLAAVTDALRAQHATDLREAAHKLSGLLSAFSSVGGDIAGELEDLAASCKLEQTQPLVARLETLVGNMLAEVDRLTLASLRGSAASEGL